MRHETVFQLPAVEALIGDPEGSYVDTTYGRGGHSEEILGRIKGRLMVIDRDAEAIKDAEAEYKGDSRVVVVHGSFGDLQQHLESHGWSKVDGVLMDLGVSSPQLDEADRGFSFMRDGPLDMRMDQTKGMTASDWLDSAEEEDIRRVLKEYGEERFSRRIANAIVSSRQETPICTTIQLVKLIEAAIPFREKHKHPATRSFQAIRIFVNDELGALKKGLEESLDALKPGGKLVVISFHSLEDRIVKRFMRDMASGDIFPARLPVTSDMLNKKLKLVTGKVKPDEDEIRRNVRSRSAVMRVAEKL